MPRGTAPTPTNDHIVRLLEAVRSELADVKRRQDEIARSVERLLKQRSP
jgi:hypothetical protein